MAQDIRRIATEEAFSIPEHMAALLQLTKSTWDSLDLKLPRRSAVPGSPLYKRLVDLERERIEIMDEDKVAMHVLSLTSPGVQMFDADLACEIATLANDRLADVIKRHPARFAGLAAFAPQDPKRAVKEMERAIRTLKLNGFILNSHTGGEYLDNPKFWPILECAEALDRAIYIHPRCPPESMAKPYGDYGMYTALWGFQAEVSVHCMRMMLSGVFERFPKLKIVIGHMGESIPFNTWRTDYIYGVHKEWGDVPGNMKPSEIFKRNFWITTSGVEHTPALKYCIDVLGPDRILWAIDYPYQPSKPATAWMNGADISPAHKEMIFHGNAERIFKIEG
jgi:2,3-dihydroxybenzoate decarboxylase/5-carboxyvanillate decarboxylase